jgi:hypothetical protein
MDNPATTRKRGTRREADIITPLSVGRTSLLTGGEMPSGV